MIEVCPGHVLDRRILDWARFKFAQLAGGDFLEMARAVARLARQLNVDPYAALGDGSPESRTYEKMVAVGDWPGADKTYLDLIKVRDPELYLLTLNMEGLACEFNAALAKKLSESSHIYRWMHKVELPSYLCGTFESKVESDGRYREHKAFSLGINIHSKKRPVSLTVPLDGAIRCVIRAAVYTALPRFISSTDERIGDRKHLSYAHETECRLPTGTRVPRGTRLTINHNMLDLERDNATRSVLASLKDVMDV